VRLVLQLHRNLSSGKIAVAVNEGFVTLKGEVASTDQKELIVDYVTMSMA